VGAGRHCGGVVLKVDQLLTTAIVVRGRSPVQPLDVVKTRLQLDKTGRYNGMVNCGVTIFRTEGAGALYKGLVPFVTHLTLKYALRFGAFAHFERLVGVDTAKDAKTRSMKTFLVRDCVGVRRRWLAPPVAASGAAAAAASAAPTAHPGDMMAMFCCRLGSLLVSRRLSSSLRPLKVPLLVLKLWRNSRL
jgi:hypothetical protein